MAAGPELELLLLAGRLLIGTARDEEAIALLRLPLDWTLLQQKAAAEGMEGLLAFQLRRLARVYHLDLPLAPLTQALHCIFACNGALVTELAAFRQALRQGGRQVILLKGGALLETIYRGQVGLRPLSDLDLLIKAADLPAIEAVLHRRGCRPLSPSSLFFVNDAAAFDLHLDLAGETRVRRKALAFHFEAEALWREASPLDPQDPTILVLSPLHQVLYLAVHALKHSFSRLIWFVDLGLLLPHVRWEELVDRAAAAGALRALAYALVGLQRLLGVKVPPELLGRLPRFNGIERRFLQTVVSRRAMLTPGEVMVVFAIPGCMGKLGYLLELGLPRRKVLAQDYPSMPSWLLYPRRLMRLLALGFQEGRGFWWQRQGRKPRGY